MKKLVKSIKMVAGLLLFGVLNEQALAEKSGAFLGVEIGFGGGTITSNLDKCESCQDLSSAYLQNRESLNGDGASYGLVAGYKVFFNRYVGLRFYANMNAMRANFNNVAKDSALPSNISTTTLNYVANVDFLGNFIVGTNESFGGFIGLGIGANTWLGSDLATLKRFYQASLSNDEIDQNLNGLNRNKTGFDIALNVGLRGTLYKHHGVELVARVSFMGTRLFYEDYKNYTLQDDILVLDKYIQASTTAHIPCTLSLRYIYAF